MPQSPLAQRQTTIRLRAFIASIGVITFVGLACASCCQAQEPSEPFLAKVVGDAPNRLEAGRWGNLLIEATNPDDFPITVQAVVSFEPQHAREFRRSIWLPPNAIRRCWIPVLPPPRASQGPWTVKVRFVKTTSSGEVDLRLESSNARFETTLLGKFTASPPQHPTLVIASPRLEDVDDIYLSAQEVRQAAGLSSVLMATSDARPSVSQWLGSVSVVVLAEDLEQSGSIESLQRWTRSGGVLWIRAERVGDATLQALLGDKAPTVVGRETVNDLSFKRMFPSEETTDDLAFDDPTPLCLIHTPSDPQDSQSEVFFTTGQWPGGIVLPWNSGRIIITTTDPIVWPHKVRLWVGDALFADVDQNKRVPSDPWPQPLAAAAAATLHEQVGQGIPSKPVVLGVLAAMLLTVAGGGGWMWRNGRLEHLLWLVPSAAVAATLTLVAMGLQMRGKAPSTIATLQLAQASPGTGTLNIHSATLAYYPEPANGAVQGGIDVATDPETLPPRVMHTASGDWKWKSDRVPSGSRVFHIESQTNSDFHVTARFSDRGIEGQIAPVPEAKEHAILVSRGMPALEVTWGDDGRFHAGPRNLMGIGQHVPGSMLGDQGRRRQQFLNTLWAPGALHPVRGQMELVFWTKPFASDIQWPDVENQIGDAVVVAPVQFQPVTPEKQIVVPGSVLSMRIRSPMFNMRQQRWIGHSSGPADEVSIKFVVPQSLRHVRFDKAQMACKWNVPGRDVEWMRPDKSSLQRFSGPVGLNEWTIEDADVLTPNADGEISLLMRVHETEVLNQDGVPAETQWSIDYLLMHLEGAAP